MAGREAMSALVDAAEDYLRLRRALGYKLERQGQLLRRFVRYVDGLGADHVTVDLALDWATLPKEAQPVWWHLRLGVVRGFAAHQVTIDPRTEIPPTDLLPPALGQEDSVSLLDGGDHIADARSGRLALPAQGGHL